MGSRWANKNLCHYELSKSRCRCEEWTRCASTRVSSFVLYRIISYGGIHYIRHPGQSYARDVGNTSILRTWPSQRFDLTHMTRQRVITWWNAVPYMCPLPYQRKQLLSHGSTAYPVLCIHIFDYVMNNYLYTMDSLWIILFNTPP